MRRALGLQLPRRAETPDPERGGEPARSSAPATGQRKRRFVQDGEVPVTVLPRRGDRDPVTIRPPMAGLALHGSDAGAALAAERTAREQAEQALRDAQSTIRDLQTKLAHAELAQGEAMAKARLHAEEAAALASRLRDATEAPSAAVDRRADAAPARDAARGAAKSSRRNARQREPQPVKWWIKRRS